MLFDLTAAGTLPEKLNQQSKAVLDGLWKALKPGQQFRLAPTILVSHLLQQRPQACRASHTPSIACTPRLLPGEGHWGQLEALC